MSTVPPQLPIPSRTLYSLITEAHQTAKDKGWWGPDGTEYRNDFEILALMHSEISEAVEELRAGHSVSEVYFDRDRSVVDHANGTRVPKPEGYLAELADLLIRMGDAIGKHGLTHDFIFVLEEKLRYNKLRPYRHGGKTA